jgi:molecular chaperone GrpE
MSDPAEIQPASTPADATATASDSAAEAPEQTIERLTAELAEMRDKWMRAEAETQNVRTRAQRETADARNYAIQKFARDVVEVAENLRRGLDALPPPTPGEPELLTKLRDGFGGVERSFLGVLERNGVAKKEAQDQPFDAEFHQAMAEQPAPPGVKPGTVIQAWTPAWTLNGRLLKPAMVVVASGGNEQDR